MKSLSFVWLFLAAILLSGCAAPTLQQRAAKADFGPPPANALQVVRAYFSKTTYNPASLQIQSVGQPYKGYAYDPAFIPKGQNFGWGIKAAVKATDHGGYALGWKQYVLFVRNGTVFNAFEVIPPQTAEGFVQPVQ
jgi:hypothetical protein